MSAISRRPKIRNNSPLRRLLLRFKMFKPFQPLRSVQAPTSFLPRVSRGRRKEGEHSWRAWCVCGRQSELCELGVSAVNNKASE